MLKNNKRIISEDIDYILGSQLPWSTFSGCKVVVTGAGGFLGGYLVRTLLALNHQGVISQSLKVIAFVRDRQRANQTFADIEGDPNFHIFEWDLNAISVPGLKDINYVFHAASQASPKFYGSDPVGTLLPNAVGTAALLSMLQKCADPRGFLFVSSSEVYGAVADDVVLNERNYGSIDPAAVRSCYAESKRMGETICVAWFHQNKLPTYIVRPFHTYGPGLQPNDGRVFADFVFNVLRNEDIVMNSDGSSRRAFCYVSDAISGFFTVMLKGTPAEPYNVANPKGELSVFELSELLVALYPEKDLKVKRRTVENGSYLSSTFNRLIPDISKLNALGWQPSILPKEGFRRMIENYAHEYHQ